MRKIINYSCCHFCRSRVIYVNFEMPTSAPQVKPCPNAAPRGAFSPKSEAGSTGNIKTFCRKLFWFRSFYHWPCCPPSISLPSSTPSQSRRVLDLCGASREIWIGRPEGNMCWNEQISKLYIEHKRSELYTVLDVMNVGTVMRVLK